jgi:peptide methionine sulfoxide reductase msrA/msrB
MSRRTAQRHLIASMFLALLAQVAPAAVRETKGSDMNGKGPAPTTQEAFFAGGCFWGVEYWLQKAPGVILVESGYMGGGVDAPTYEQVCTGKTGHAETVRVVFDPARTTYEAVARLFFEIHDPTEVDRQGPDVGKQYRSAVFYAGDEQRKVAEKLIAELTARGYKVATRVEPAGKFWRAEEYHQRYYEHKGTTPYCHARVRRFGG